MRLACLLLTLALCILSPMDRPALADPSDVEAAKKHWAFQKVRRPEVPKVKNAAWVRTPVDAFILARLEQEGLRPAPPVDRRTLLRRVYLDLIGLPPTPDEQRAFLEDKSPDAYAKVVDQLLSRPQYGERWARHWLDLVRFAESNGYERDGAKPHAWRYRDYVIDSFNKDKPYDQFLTEQLAGDEIDGSNAETQIATTFLRLGTWDDEPAEFMFDRYEQLDDVLGTTATALLGLTLRCARCHDHKFEPFSQVDYYRVLAMFEPLKRPEIIASATHRKELERFVGSEEELRPFREKTTAVAASQVGHAYRLSPVGLSPASLSMQLVALQPLRPKEPPRAYIWYEDSPTAPPTHLLRRGNPTRPGEKVEPGLPVVLIDKQPEPPRPTAKSTGRRLALARWMAGPDNSLVARVMVNRIWQHHFGEGLVSSENDFGVMGQAPTHPELLDWLASEFMASGGFTASGGRQAPEWSLKKMHRLIVLSNTYQMSSAPNVEAMKVDPENLLLWRWRQRRLEAEAVRDSVLAVSGQLNPQMGGPGVYPPLPRAVLEGQSRPGEGWGKSDERQSARRSIYIFVKRALAVPELEALNSPDTTSSCEQRPVATIAPQALTFLNGDFMQQQARHFAARLEREAGDDPKAQVQRAFAVALCRPARPEELQASLEFLSKQQRQIQQDAKKAGKDVSDAKRKALEAFCLVVLNTNEFVYWD